MDPLKFPPRALPIVGQPCVVHPGWTVIAPITCNCEARTVLTVYLGQNMPPAICPACMNVFGITILQYNTAQNVPGGIGVGIIGKASKNLDEGDVESTVKKATELSN